MFAYLRCGVLHGTLPKCAPIIDCSTISIYICSKKVAIPGGVQLRCLAWCAESGWIACGGDNALLKVGMRLCKTPQSYGVDVA